VVQVAVEIGIAGSVDENLITLFQVLEHVIDGVNAETVSALVQPKPNDVLDFLSDRLMAVIEVRLFFQELMQIALASGRMIGPCTCVEYRNLSKTININFINFMTVWEITQLVGYSRITPSSSTTQSLHT